MATITFLEQEYQITDGELSGPGGSDKKQIQEVLDTLPTGPQYGDWDVFAAYALVDRIGAEIVEAVPRYFPEMDEDGAEIVY